MLLDILVLWKKKNSKNLFHSHHSFKLLFQVQIEGLRAAFDDIILMHLSAFTYDDQKTGLPLNMKISLLDTQIIVKVSCIHGVLKK